MRKVLLMMTVLSVVCAGSLFAQERSISGAVTSAEDGSGLPGVNVILKGTTIGTVTDVDGNYKLSVPQEGGTLVISFIGLQTQEIEIGNRSVVDVSMASETTQLSEVVVTAVGISRDKASLGYGVTTLGGDDALANRQEADVARLLRGKATGVNIQQTSGLSGSGTNVIIRGYSSISGNNQPLFVVDGVIFNTAQNTGNQDFTSGSASASSRFLDLDPNNIEEVTILKGLSATVLYGEAGRNGVILVTTKNGKGSTNAAKKTEISFTQGIFRSEVANTPDYQDTFGNGFNAGFGWFFSNWGAAFADTARTSYGSDYRGLNDQGQVLITHPYDQAQYNDDLPQYIDADYVYQPYKSVEDFFQPGLSSVTSLAITTPVAANTTVSATYSYLTDEGFTPRLEADNSRDGRTNYLDKHNLGVGFNTQLQNGLSIKTSLNYVDTDRETPITAPAFGGDGNGLFAAILFTPRSMDLNGLEFASPVDGSNVYYRRGSAIQNPRWTLNNSGQHERIKRFFGSIDLSYKITDWLTGQYRLSIDSYNQENQRRVNKGGPRQPLGELTTSNIVNTITDQVFNFLYDFKLSETFRLDGVVGFNTRRETYGENGIISTNQFVFNQFTHQNYIDNNSYSFITEENTLGLYATANLSYKTWLYLNLQARNDWTSTLEKENRALLYPSASISWIINDMDAVSWGTVDQLKVRVGYGTSAGYPDPYRTRNVLDAQTNVFVTNDNTVLNTNSVAGFLGNPDLKPELHREVELGIEYIGFNNLIGVDLSLYRRGSDDLLVDLPLDPSTGFFATTVNAAELTNTGIELGLNVNPRLGPVQWNNTFNYTRNISNVVTISEGLDQIQVDGYGTLGNYAIPGQGYGVLFGETFLRDPNSGLLVVDGQGAYQSSGNFGVIGDPNEDFRLSWLTNFSWKGLSFGFMFDYVQGGDIFSSTVQALLARGNTVDTDVDRNIPLIMPNAVKEDGTDSDGNTIFAPNDVQTYIGDSFFRAYFFADDGGVFDATVIRLREISLSYVLPAQLLQNTPFGRIGITLSAENMWYNAPNFPKGINFDPELSSTGVGNGRGFDFRTAPTAKKYGFNINLTF